MEPTIIGKLLAMGCLIVALNLNSVDAQIPTESRWLNFEARGLCQIIDEPYVYSGQCEIGINRLLARSVATYGLSQYNNDDKCYGVNGTQYNSDYNCDPPYNLCWGRCPLKYNEIIDATLQLKATMLVRAGSIYGKEDSFLENYINEPGHPYQYSFYQTEQLVKDVNEAFDCAGLRRPIIQGEILEGIGVSDVNNIAIP